MVAQNIPSDTAHAPCRGRPPAGAGAAVPAEGNAVITTVAPGGALAPKDDMALCPVAPACGPDTELKMLPTSLTKVAVWSLLSWYR